MSDRVVVEVHDGIADARLNRPEKMNAIDSEMFQELAQAADEIAQDSGVRVVVLSGEGRCFCAGLDMTSFAAMAGKGEANADRPSGLLVSSKVESPANFAQRAAWAWQELPVPVIAAVHGVAYGGGIQIALAADIRIVAPDARLSVMEIKWGLIPDMSGTQTLRHLVRLDVAKELVFSGRVVSGTEAVELGLATRVADDPRAAALELAREIASKSPDAIRAGKQLLNQSVQSTLSEGLEREARLQAALIGSPNQIEAVTSNLERREPKFSDPK